MMAQSNQTNELDIFQSVQSEADKLRKSIMKVQQKLVKHKFDLNLNLVLFAIISFVLIVFLIIVINDLFKTLMLYFKKKKLLSTKSSLKDNYQNVDNPLIIEKNELDEIEDNIMIQRRNQQAHFDDINRRKQRIDLPVKDTVEGGIDLRVLDDKFDDYTYDKSKDGFSFWKLLILPPDFTQHVKKNDKKPYIQF